MSLFRSFFKPASGLRHVHTAGYSVAALVLSSDCVFRPCVSFLGIIESHSKGLTGRGRDSRPTQWTREGLLQLFQRLRGRIRATPLSCLAVMVLHSNGTARAYEFSATQNAMPLGATKRIRLQSLQANRAVVIRSVVNSRRA